MRSVLVGRRLLEEAHFVGGCSKITVDFVDSLEIPEGIENFLFLLLSLVLANSVHLHIFFLWTLRLSWGEWRATGGFFRSEGFISVRNERAALILILFDLLNSGGI